MTLKQACTAAERIEQLEEALFGLISAGEDFIEGEGSQVVVDLDYCEALAQLEQAVEQGKRVYPRPAVDVRLARV